MKTNEQIVEIFQRRQFDSMRYACLGRIKEYKFDPQLWELLGQAMIGLKRGRMAELCFRRSLLLDPFATWESDMEKALQTVDTGRDDKQVLRVLEVPHITVSACILTRDSSRTIRQCIEALQGAVDEIIVVDTGSTDDTVAIVESFGIKVYFFEWIDDFAAARNYALSLVNSEWIISIDSDEILYQEDKEKIRSAAAMFNSTKYLVKILIMNRIGDSISPSYATRMFKKSGYKWQYPIHETVVDNQNAELPTTCTLKIRLFHDGYDRSVVDLYEKWNRNIRILENVVDENPSNIQFNYYLGRELMNLGKSEKAISHLEKSLQLACENADNQTASIIMPDICILLYKIYKVSERQEDAKKIVYQLTQTMPDYPDGWFYYGIETIESPSYDPQTAIEFFSLAKNTASIYRGPSNSDLEIGQWKADSILGQLMEKHGLLNR